MTDPACACTLAIAPLMLDVVSATNMMSGFGGIDGVCTVFVTTSDWPGLSVAVTDAGSTPGTADAVLMPATSASSNAAQSDERLRLLRFLTSSPLCSWCPASSPYERTRRLSAAAEWSARCRRQLQEDRAPPRRSPIAADTGEPSATPLSRSLLSVAVLVSREEVCNG